MACGGLEHQTCQHSNQEWMWIGGDGPRDGGREMHGGEDGTGRAGDGREVDGRVSWPRPVAVDVGVGVGVGVGVAP